MRRTFAVLALLFGHHGALAFMSGTAVLLLAIGVFVGPELVLGNAFAVFALLWASNSFRQFVSNVRLSLLPGFRSHAVGALLLAATAIGAAAALAAFISPEPEAEVLGTGLLAFALSSAYILVAQWVSTARAPLLVQLLLVMLMFRYVGNGDAFSGVLGRHAWACALAAMLGWAWLFRSVQGGARIAGPHPMLRIEQTSGVRPRQWTLEAFGIGPLDIGRPAHSAGTLMRGSNDGWFNRVGDLLFWVVGFAFVWTLSIYGFESASESQWGPALEPVPAFLLLSFAATAFQAPRYFDWPARLRYLWLRTPGGRAALWRMLERAVVTEAAIVAVITAGVSAVLIVAADTSIDLSLTYVLGCTTGVLLGAYGAMGMRIAGATAVAVHIAAFLGWMPIVMILMFAGPEPTVLKSALVVIVVLAVVARFVTWRMFLRMDWCAVKPLRDPTAAARA